MHVLNAARQVSLRKLILWSQTILYGAHPTNPNFLTERHALRQRAIIADERAPGACRRRWNQ